MSLFVQPDSGAIQPVPQIEATDNEHIVLERRRLAISVLGFGGTILALSLGLIQYRRGEKWKRIEFIAREVKEFEKDATVQLGFVLIDWGVRNVNLYNVTSPREEDLIRVSRQDQWRGLIPHSVPHAVLPVSKAAPDPNVNNKRTYSGPEARIRDVYNVFFNHLDRFGAFVESGLISAQELAPFIRYWVDTIATNKGSPHEARWRYALLTYIQYYRFSNTVILFDKMGYDIRYEGALYRSVATRAEHDGLVVALRDALMASVPPSSVPLEEVS